MRLRVGLVLASIATVLVLCALPASWYHVRVVGPNFENAMDASQPTQNQDLKELNGDWTLWKHELTDEPFDVPATQYFDPLTVGLYGDKSVQAPNANAIAVYSDTSAMVVAGTVALAVGVFGAINIARNDRWRMFTAASFVLAAVLLLAAPAYFGANLPSAMRKDASTGDPDAFGAAFEPYLNPETRTIGYYSDFSGGYSNTDPNAREQFSYGPGSGWLLSGIGAVLSLITAGVLYGAPQWKPLRWRRAEREVLRYVPVPVVTSVPTVPRYPWRAGTYDASPASPELPPEMRHPGIAQVPPSVDRYRR